MLSVPPQNAHPIGYDQQGPSTSQPYPMQVGTPQPAFYQQQRLTPSASPMPSRPSSRGGPMMRGQDRVQRWANPYPQAGQYAPSPAHSMMSVNSGMSGVSEMDMSVMSMQSMTSLISHSSASHQYMQAMRRIPTQQPTQPRPSPLGENVDPIAQNRAYFAIEKLREVLQSSNWLSIIERPEFWREIYDLFPSDGFMMCTKQVLADFLCLFIQRFSTQGVPSKHVLCFVMALWHLMVYREQVHESIIAIYTHDRAKLRHLMSLVEYGDDKASQHTSYYALQIIYMLALGKFQGTSSRMAKRNEEILGELRGELRFGHLVFLKYFMVKELKYSYLKLFHRIIERNAQLAQSLAQDPRPFETLIFHLKQATAFEATNENTPQPVQPKGLRTLKAVSWLLQILEWILDRASDEMIILIMKQGFVETIIGRVHSMGAEVFGLGIKIVQKCSHFREGLKCAEMSNVFIKIFDALSDKKVLRDEVIFSNTFGFLMNAIAVEDNKVKLIGTGILVNIPEWLDYCLKNAAANRLKEADLIDNLIGVIINLTKTNFRMDPERFQILLNSTSRTQLNPQKCREVFHSLLSQKGIQVSLLGLLNLKQYGSTSNLSTGRRSDIEKQRSILRTTLVTKSRIIRLINLLIVSIWTPARTEELGAVVDQLSGANIVDTLHQLAFQYQEPPRDRELYEESLKLETEIFRLLSTIHDRCPRLKESLENLFKHRQSNPLELLNHYDIHETKELTAFVCSILEFCKRICGDREVAISFANYQAKLDDLCNSGDHKIQNPARELMNLMQTDISLQVDPLVGYYSRGFEDSDTMEQ